MRLTKLPDWIRDLIKEAREFPGLTSGFNLDEWESFDEYGADLKRRLQGAREAQKAGTLDDYLEEVRKRPSPALKRLRKR